LTQNFLWEYVPKLPQSIIISSKSGFYTYWELVIVLVAVI
jgi:hypothetical protein